MSEEEEQYFKGTSQVEHYAQFRPSPPDHLINTVLDFVKEKRECPLTLCVDAGCGSGQNTVKVSPHFQQVVAVDVSGPQLSAARAKHQLHNVLYKECGAEKLPVEDESVDLIACCCALMYFNLEEFYPEVQRVLKPGGVLACYGSNLPTYIINGNIPYDMYTEDVATKVKHWPKQNYHVKTDLANLPAPFQEEVLVRAKEGKFIVEENVTVDSVLGYFRCTIIYEMLRDKEGKEKAEKLQLQLKEKLLALQGTGNEGNTLKQMFSFHLRMWRKPSP